MVSGIALHTNLYYSCDPNRQGPFPGESAQLFPDRDVSFYRCRGLCDHSVAFREIIRVHFSDLELRFRALLDRPLLSRPHAEDQGLVHEKIRVLT